jgi:mono/diheme cytochrome c family protein
LVVSLAGLSGCDNRQESGMHIQKTTVPSERTVAIERWYSGDMVVRGEPLYQTHCASCHKPDASGSANWKEMTADDKYPPPPLNGTAHTWHHPLPALRRTVRMGGIPLGGSMPAFAGKLSDQEIDNLLAWIQSHWSDQIYLVWDERNRQAGKPLQPIARAEQ